MVRYETHIVNEIFAHRFRGPAPRYALVISHGLGGHGGIYHRFCTHHAAKGVDVWSYDAPGHGQSTTNRPRGQWTLAEWTEATVTYAEHIKSETGLPVFALGSSLGVAAAFSSLYSEAITGALLMGAPAVPTGPQLGALSSIWRSESVQKMLSINGRALRLDVNLMINFDTDYGYSGAGEQKRLDPWNTWSYDLASWATLFTFDPKVSASGNTKPILVSCGEKDPIHPKEVMRALADGIAGPVEFYCLEGGSHQLMLFHTEEYSRVVHDWVLRQL